MRLKPFQHIERRFPRRSVFNLSHYKIFDADMGLIYPVLCRKMVPGDKFSLSNEIVVRANPLVAPIMHEINAYTHYFFVPLRLLWNESLGDIGNFEDYFTGGKDGDLKYTPPRFAPRIAKLGDLWDHFGFSLDRSVNPNPDPANLVPEAYPRRAYNFIWNEYYRDQNFMDEVSIDNNDLLYRCWEKDYFTSALPWQQRGTAPALPISGFTSAEFLGAIEAMTGNVPSGDGAYFTNDTFGSNTTFRNHDVGALAPVVEQNVRGWFNNNRVDLSNASTFDVSDLRLAFQTQKFLERSARAGSRYTEALKAHYGVSPRDDRLQRPEYIGGTRAPIVISEVLQTSSSDSTSPQGNLAGHGMTFDRRRVASYYAQEFGVIMGLFSIMPRPLYEQGISREWLTRSRFDELLPEFVNLSEQAIYVGEILFGGSSSVNEAIFGYQGRYDEYRTARNYVSGRLRSPHPVYNPQSLNFWHLSRYFASRPYLNEDFLRCEPRKDSWAAPNEPAFIVTFGNIIRAVRPLPIVGTPGLIDHH